MTLPWFFLLHMGVSENLWYPQIIHVNRVFHCINHPFRGGYPYFRKHPYVVHVGSMWKPGPQPSKTSAPYPLPLSFPQPKRPKTRASWELKANLLLCGCVCGWGDGMGKLDEDVNDVSWSFGRCLFMLRFVFYRENILNYMRSWFLRVSVFPMFKVCVCFFSEKKNIRTPRWTRDHLHLRSAAGQASWRCFLLPLGSPLPLPPRCDATSAEDRSPLSTGWRF